MIHYICALVERIKAVDGYPDQVSLAAALPIVLQGGDTRVLLKMRDGALELAQRIEAELVRRPNDDDAILEPSHRTHTTRALESLDRAELAPRLTTTDRIGMQARARAVKNADVLDQIAALMSGSSWCPNTIEAVAALVQLSGRTIEDYDGEEGNA